VICKRLELEAFLPWSLHSGMFVSHVHIGRRVRGAGK
jgi:hypothetical protein